MKTVVYTALFTDNVDSTYGGVGLFDYTHDKDGVDYIAYTNCPHLKSNFWDIRVCDIENCARYSARKVKILSHEYVKDYDYSIWLDNQCYHTYDVNSIIDFYLDGYDIAIHKHIDRDCIYDEAKVCIDRRLDSPEIINSQIERYRNSGYPKNNGLFESGVFMRRHTDDVMIFNDHWWSEVKENSIRDQISLPYVLWKHPRIKINKIEETFCSHQSALGRKKTDVFGTVDRKTINRI